MIYEDNTVPYFYRCRSGIKLIYIYFLAAEYLWLLSLLVAPHAKIFLPKLSPLLARMIIRRNNGRWSEIRISSIRRKEGRKYFLTIRGEPIGPPHFDSFHEITGGTPVAQYGHGYKEMFAQQRLIALSFCPLSSLRGSWWKRREKSLYISCVYTSYPLVCYSRLCPPFDPFQPFPPTFFSCQRIAANETAISGRVKPIGTPSAFRVGRDFVAAFQLFDFFYLPTTSNCFRFSSVTRRQERESRACIAVQVRCVYL